MIKFCGVPGKILSKSQQLFYGYNEIGYNECMDLSKLILSPVNIENNEIYTFYCELF